MVRARGGRGLGPVARGEADEDRPLAAVVTPTRFAHAVFRTARFDEMKEFFEEPEGRPPDVQMAPLEEVFHLD